MAEDVGTIYYSVDAKTDKLIDAGKKATDTLDVLTDAFDKVDGSAKDAGKTLDTTGGKLVDLGKDAKDAGGKIDGTGASFVDMGKDAKDAGAKVDGAGASLIDLGKDATGAEQKIDSTGGALIDLGRDASDAGKKIDNLGTNLSKTGKESTDSAAALRRLLGQIDPVVAKTQQLDKWTEELGQHFDAGRLSTTQYSAELAKLDKRYAELQTSTVATAKSSKDFSASLTPIAAALGLMISAQTLQQWGKLAEQFTLFQARITRLAGDTDKATVSYQALLQISSKTGSSMTDTVKLWESLTGTLTALGATNAQVLQLTGTLQKIGTIGGSSAEETSNALRQLSQGLAGGTLRAEEFNSVIENTPELARQIAKGFGVTMGQLRQMMIDGQITAEKLFEVLLGRSQDVNAEFEKLPRTIGQAANALTTQFGAALSVIDKATGASRTLAAALDAVAKGVQQSFNPTDQEKLNQLLRDRATAEQQYATQVKFGLRNTADETSQRIDAINNEIKAIQDRRVAQQKEESGTGGKPRVAPTTTPDGQKALQQMAEQNVLLRVQGVERAKLAAIQKLGASATDSERAAAVALAVENFNLSEAEKQQKKDKTKGISDLAKAERAAETERRKAAKELQTANDSDQKKFAELGQSIAKVGQTARDAAQDAAQMSLSKFATPDEIQRIRDMAGALYDLKGAKAAVAAADPIANQQQSYDEELKQLNDLNAQKLISDQRYLELKHIAETDNAAKMKTLQEENFKAQAVGNQVLFDSLDALGQQGAQALAGLAVGTSNWQEALGGVAQTVLGTVIGAFTQMGTDWIKQQIMMSASAQATTAAQTAGIGAVTAAQAGATAAIATTTTATAATTGTAVASSMAPAAGLSSIASFGGAAVIGGAALLATMLLAKSFGGGRRAGGNVSANSVYRVNEGGAPEVFSAGGQQYMIPNQRGQVVNNKDATAQAAGGGGSTAPIVNVHIYTGQNASASARFSEADRAWVVDVIAGDQMGGGKTAHSTNSITNTRRAGN